jgi:5-methylcytosine-specific restriction endonuclease McrA
MLTELDEAERRALRHRSRIAILGALESLGGEAQRSELLDRATANGAFSDRELTAAAPTAASGRYERLVDYELSWTLTSLRREGLLDNPRRSVWRLAGAAAEPLAPALEARPGTERLAELREMPYREYLRTPEWRKTRAAALLRSGHSCAVDVTHTKDLEVHHRTYERLGEELETDLLVLCRDCHRSHHQRNGRPRKATRSGSSATRRRTQTALREFIVQLFALAGFIIGALMGFAARPHTVGHVACRVDTCLTAGIVDQLLPLVRYALGGLMVGGLVGVVLALCVRLDRRA